MQCTANMSRMLRYRRVLESFGPRDVAGAREVGWGEVGWGEVRRAADADESPYPTYESELCVRVCARACGGGCCAGRM